MGVAGEALSVCDECSDCSFSSFVTSKLSSTVERGKERVAKEGEEVLGEGEKKIKRGCSKRCLV